MPKFHRRRGAASLSSAGMVNRVRALLALLVLLVSAAVAGASANKVVGEAAMGSGREGASLIDRIAAAALDRPCGEVGAAS